MSDMDKIKTFITDNVLHSDSWDKADDTRRTKAVNNAKLVLLSVLPDIFKSEQELEVSDIAFQAVWMLKIDDSFQRAEMGVQQMTVDGVTILFRNKDNTLASQVALKYGIVLINGQRRRVGSYRIPQHSTFRIPADGSQKLAEERR